MRTPMVLTVLSLAVMWTYHQSSGQLFHENDLVAIGFAGQAEGKNNPFMQDVRHTGPLPQGLYLICDQQYNKRAGVGFPLKRMRVPSKRRGTWWIHAGHASRGCPIVDVEALDRITDILAATNDRTLQVLV